MSEHGNNDKVGRHQVHEACYWSVPGALTSGTRHGSTQSCCLALSGPSNGHVKTSTWDQPCCACGAVPQNVVPDAHASSATKRGSVGYGKSPEKRAFSPSENSGTADAVDRNLDEERISVGSSSPKRTDGCSGHSVSVGSVQHVAHNSPPQGSYGNVNRVAKPKSKMLTHMLVPGRHRLNPSHSKPSSRSAPTLFSARTLSTSQPGSPSTGQKDKARIAALWAPDADLNAVAAQLHGIPSSARVDADLFRSDAGCGDLDLEKEGLEATTDTSSEFLWSKGHGHKQKSPPGEQIDATQSGGSQVCENRSGGRYSGRRAHTPPDPEIPRPSNARPTSDSDSLGCRTSISEAEVTEHGKSASRDCPNPQATAPASASDKAQRDTSSDAPSDVDSAVPKRTASAKSGTSASSVPRDDDVDGLWS